MDKVQKPNNSEYQQTIISSSTSTKTSSAVNEKHQRRPKISLWKEANGGFINNYSKSR
jgi:hypothetical protein